MSQTIDNSVTVAPLAEVTKSRPILENSLNNVSGGQKPSHGTSTKKGKKTKAATNSEKEQEQQPIVSEAAQSVVLATQQLGSKNHKDYIRPWSTMTTQELAQWAKDTGLDQEEEGAAQPSRRRMPKTTQVKTTTTTVPNTPVSAQPSRKQHQQQTNSYTNSRSAGSSPLYAQPSSQNVGFPRFPTYASTQSGSSPTMMMQPSTSFDQATMHQTFSNSSYGAAAGRSSTPPEDYLPQQQTSVVEESVYVVSVRQNDPYAFNVIGESAISTVMNSSASGVYFYGSPVSTNSLMNASVDSEGTVGYVNSAEVSPVKVGQSETSLNSPVTFTAYPQRRGESEEVMSRSTTDSAARKHQRVYVNGRPVIKA